MTRIVRTRDTCGGRPRIEGTRITTALIIRKVNGGYSIADILNDYPHLTPAGVRAAIRYEMRPHRRLRRWIGGFLPEFEGTVTWRGREWYR